jgi:hypothetical protein
LDNVVELNRERHFSVDEANALMPLLHKITLCASTEVKSLINRLDAMKADNQEYVEFVENQINDTISRWQTKLEKLGINPKGLWIADFDAGDGYYCWKYPESEIKYWHGYNDGFSGRIPIDQR